MLLRHKLTDRYWRKKKVHTEKSSGSVSHFDVSKPSYINVFHQHLTYNTCQLCQYLLNRKYLIHPRLVVSFKTWELYSPGILKDVPAFHWWWITPEGREGKKDIGCIGGKGTWAHPTVSHRARFSRQQMRCV